MGRPKKKQSQKGLLQKYQFFKSHFKQNAHVSLNITCVSFFFCYLLLSFFLFFRFFLLSSHSRTISSPHPSTSSVFFSFLLLSSSFIFLKKKKIQFDKSDIVQSKRSFGVVVFKSSIRSKQNTKMENQQQAVDDAKKPRSPAGSPKHDKQPNSHTSDYAPYPKIGPSDVSPLQRIGRTSHLRLLLLLKLPL